MMRRPGSSCISDSRHVSTGAIALLFFVNAAFQVHQVIGAVGHPRDTQARKRHPSAENIRHGERANPARNTGSSVAPALAPPPQSRSLRPRPFHTNDRLLLGSVSITMRSCALQGKSVFLGPNHSYDMAKPTARNSGPPAKFHTPWPTSSIRANFTM